MLKGVLPLEAVPKHGEPALLESSGHIFVMI